MPTMGATRLAGTAGESRGAPASLSTAPALVTIQKPLLGAGVTAAMGPGGAVLPTGGASPNDSTHPPDPTIQYPLPSAVGAIPTARIPEADPWAVASPNG